MLSVHHGFAETRKGVPTDQGRHAQWQLFSASRRFCQGEIPRGNSKGKFQEEIPEETPQNCHGGTGQYLDTSLRSRPSVPVRWQPT
jgi:hypothetical protein